MNAYIYIGKKRVYINCIREGQKGKQKKSESFALVKKWHVSHKGKGCKIGSEDYVYCYYDVPQLNKNHAMLKNEGHQVFDQIWQKGHMTRTEAYYWLAQEMGIPEKEAHFSVMTKYQCIEAKNISRAYLDRL